MGKFGKVERVLYDFDKKETDITPDEAIKPADGKALTEAVVLLVKAERLRQNTKWGFPQSKTTAEWGIILGEEVGEVMKELNDVHFDKKPQDDLISELVQVAAVSVSMIEHILLEKEGGQGR
jgi:NTP pyrophosphatase (non-canonical NTP hydrolase)